MNNTKIKDIHCNSDQLYKSDSGKQANQKYQSRQCKHQFAPHSISKAKKSKYPKDDKVLYSLHKYRHYNHYKCT